MSAPALPRNAVTPTLMSAMARRAGLAPNGLAFHLGCAFAGSLLIAAGAQVAVPLFPVPITLQTFAVLLVAMTLGARGGATAVLLYLLEGAMGLPVFANGAFGAARLVGPTGGYLFGFLLAAVVVGRMSERGFSRAYLPALAAMLVGDAIILSIGGAWLALTFGAGDPAGGFFAGVVPFIPGAVVKSAAAAALLPVAWRLAHRR